MLLNKPKISMVESLLLNIDAEYTATFIAKKKNQNQKSVQLFLDSLETEGILKSRFEGKNKLFSWNKNNQLIVTQFILSVEHLRTLYFYKSNPLIKQVLEELLPEIKGIALIFGSFADNTQTGGSDVDIAIIGKYDEESIQRIIELYNLDISIKHMKKYEENALTKEIQKKHILLKNAEMYVKEDITWIN